MTKNFKTIFILSALMFGWLIGANNSNAATLAATLKGKILLQVEQNGEAWYVNPTNELRYYLGRLNDAFNIMRELGLGISNKDFDSFKGYAPSRLSGRILLKVEDSGKAYYVNTNDLKMYYLGRPADAFSVMRELGLGITDKNLSLISMANNKYTNRQHGFEFSYPSNYKISEVGGGITTTVIIDKGSYNNLYFLFQARADNYSTYNVLSTKKIMVGNKEAIERLFLIEGSSDVTLQIEIKRYMFTDGLERADSFGRNFKNIEDANAGAKEIEDMAKTLKYF